MKQLAVIDESKDFLKKIASFMLCMLWYDGR